MTTPGQKLRDAMNQESPLQIAGVINAYCAILAEHSGLKAIYVSGAGVANASYGLPDLGYTRLSDVLIDVERITNVTKLPVLVDVDTGWDDPAKTVEAMIEAGAAGIHIEDQVDAKRCGHRPGKMLVTVDEMVDRIKAAVLGKNAAAEIDPEFVIIARTDALAVEGIDGTLARTQAYVDAGADMIFAEALTDLSEYAQFVSDISVPVLANITEFGNTPLYTRQELGQVGVGLILYPLSAFRAMSSAALNLYKAIKETGTQKSMIDTMQTRDELYEFLDYLQYEDKQRSES